MEGILYQIWNLTLWLSLSKSFSLLYYYRIRDYSPIHTRPTITLMD